MAQWEDQSQQMTSAYSKSYGYKKFSVHPKTKKVSFSNCSTLESVFKKFSFSRIFLCGYKHISVDGRPKRNNKVAFSNLSGIVCTGPELIISQLIESCN